MNRLSMAGFGALAVVLLAVVPAAACGSPSDPGIATAGGAVPTTSASSGGQADALKFAQCMRQHGVQMDDPVDGKIEIKGEAGDGSKIDAAQKACRKYAPDAAGGEPMSKADQERLLRFAQCMRDHGVPMADPDFSGGGVKMSISAGKDGGPSKATVDAAQKACQGLLPEGAADGPSTSQGGSGAQGDSSGGAKTGAGS
jgi:hypothetical protein